MDSKSIAKAKEKLVGMAAARKSSHHPTGKSTKAESQAFSRLNMAASSGGKATPAARTTGLARRPSPVPRPRVVPRPGVRPGVSIRSRMASRMALR